MWVVHNALWMVDNGKVQEYTAAVLPLIVNQSLLVPSLNVHKRHHHGKGEERSTAFFWRS
jgi:hypothetical protein